MAPKSIETIDDLTHDPHNANLGTTRGLSLLKESIEQCGAGRSIVADKHGVVIAGNKTLQAARDAGITIEVVQTSGQELVVVQRSDLDLLEQPKARQLAYYDNRVPEVDLLWSGTQIKQDMLDGLDLSFGFFPDEVDRLTATALDAPTPDFQETVEVRSAEAEAPTEAAPAAAAEAQADAPASVVRPSYSLVFENITQQIRWAAFLRVLRERYTAEQAQTSSKRLSLYLAELGIQ